MTDDTESLTHAPLPEPAAAAGEAPPALAPEPPPTLAEAVAALYLWEATFCRGTAISRDTHALNAIRDHLGAIGALVFAVKE